MTEYNIRHDKASFAYDPHNGHIEIGFKDGLLPDKDIIGFTSDGLTHEHMHMVLDELFGDTTCSLYDVIAHNFWDESRYRRYVKKYNDTVNINGFRFTWLQAIEKDGITQFLKDRQIDGYDILNANLKCNTRGLNE